MQLYISEHISRHQDGITFNSTQCALYNGVILSRSSCIVFLSRSWKWIAWNFFKKTHITGEPTAIFSFAHCCQWAMVFLTLLSGPVHTNMPGFNILYQFFIPISRTLR